MLMALSSGIAVAGILIAMYFWVWTAPRLRASRAASTGIYKLLLNKYYIDEVYDALNRAADPEGLDAGAVAAGPTRADRRRGQRRGEERPGDQRRPPAAPDRVGPRLRRLAVLRGGHSRVVFDTVTASGDR
jgi:hypothetical protein